jgi:hypothetical protein
MAFDWVSWVLSCVGGDALLESTLLHNLWGGYGELRRLRLSGPIGSVILKRVVPPELADGSVSDARKRRSYVVERNWYLQGSRRCDQHCRVAHCYAAEPSLLLLEDLDAAGFRPGRPPQIRAGLHWLAHFHSRFLGQSETGLWEQGCYWHLETRRDEWDRMPAGPLKDAAATLDARLRGARYQTLVHGDAKPANFCWHPDGNAAAVDFQYVGPGCGIRDVAYFLDCCLGYNGREEDALGWLDVYFTCLREAMLADGHTDAVPLELEWRSLFPVAWADFCRFEQGWGAPGPLTPFSQTQLRYSGF